MKRTPTDEQLTQAVNLLATYELGEEKFEGELGDIRARLTAAEECINVIWARLFLPDRNNGGT